MDKPSWDNAPEWANYLAMDESEEWYWHELKPRKIYSEWLSDGMVAYAGEFSPNWKNSLEERPNGT